MGGPLRGRAHCVPGVLDGTDISPLTDSWLVRDGDALGFSYSRQVEELGRHCMAGIVPDFPKHVRAGDFLVGGRGVGWGHDYDQAVMALKGCGIAAVICEATRTNFKRNCLHHGLPLVEVADVLAHVGSGDELELDLEQGVLRNLTGETKLSLAAYPDFLLEVITAGGIHPHLRQSLQREQEGGATAVAADWPSST